MLLTSSEAAARLGISKCTLLRAMRRGEIRPLLQTPGGYYRFDRADIEDYARALSTCRQRLAGA